MNLPPYSQFRYTGDQAHIIARELEKSDDPKVKDAARCLRRAADLLYEATRVRDLGEMAKTGERICR